MKMIYTTALATLLATAAFAETKDITYMPEGGYLSTTDAEYVDESIEKKLVPGQKVDELAALNFAGETIVQRLTDRSYWIQTGFYGTIAYVGDESVLLMDPLGNGRGEKVMEAIKNVTGKPVTAVIYSHHHPDHIGDIGVFIEAAKADDRKLRIIATKKTADILEGKGELPAPTEVLTAEKNTTIFETETIEVSEITNASHAEDSAIWKLVGEDIVHIPDYVNPDQMPFLGFGGSHTFTGYEEDLKQIRDTGFTFFSGGHGNIGSTADLDFMIGYVEDLKSAIFQSFGEVKYSDFVSPEVNNHAVISHNFLEAHTNATMDILRSKYGEYYGFEVSVPEQIRMARYHLTH